MAINCQPEDTRTINHNRILVCLCNYCFCTVCPLNTHARFLKYITSLFTIHTHDHIFAGQTNISATFMFLLVLCYLTVCRMHVLCFFCCRSGCRVVCLLAVQSGSRQIDHGPCATTQKRHLPTSTPGNTATSSSLT